MNPEKVVLRSVCHTHPFSAQKRFAAYHHLLIAWHILASRTNLAPDFESGRSGDESGFISRRPSRGWKLKPKFQNQTVLAMVFDSCAQPSFCQAVTTTGDMQVIGI